MYIFFYFISCAGLHSFHLSYCRFFCFFFYCHGFISSCNVCFFFFLLAVFFSIVTKYRKNSFLYFNCIQEYTVSHNSPAQCVYSAHLFIWSLPLSPNDKSSSPGHEFAGSSSPEPPSDSLGLPRYADTGPMHPANTFTILTFSVCVPI